MKEASWLNLNGVKRGGQLIGNSKEDDIKPTVKVNKRMVSVATNQPQATVEDVHLKEEILKKYDKNNMKGQDQSRHYSMICVNITNYEFLITLAILHIKSCKHIIKLISVSMEILRNAQQKGCKVKYYIHRYTYNFPLGYILYDK